MADTPQTKRRKPSQLQRIQDHAQPLWTVAEEQISGMVGGISRDDLVAHANLAPAGMLPGVLTDLLAGLAQTNAAMSVLISQIQQDVAGFASDSAESQGEVDLLSQAMASLKSGAQTTAGVISALQADLAAASSSIAAGASAASAQSQRLSTLEQASSTQGADITSLKSGQTSAGSTAAGMQTTITGMQTAATATQGRVTSLETSVAGWQSSLSTLQASVTAQAALIATCQSRLTTLEARKAAYVGITAPAATPSVLLVLGDFNALVAVVNKLRTDVTNIRSSLVTANLMASS